MDLTSHSSAAARELATEAAKHAQARDETSKARLALQNVKSAAQYESKRRENELASAIARWQKAGPNTTACITLNPNEAIGRSDALKRAAVPSEVSLLEQSIRDLDDARTVVQEENMQLREVIGDVANEVRATLLAVGREVPSMEEDLADDVSRSARCFRRRVHQRAFFEGLGGSLLIVISRQLTRTINPHLSLPPEGLTSYLTKLLIVLRDAALAAVEQAHDAVADERAREREEADGHVTELEASLATMQGDLGEQQISPPIARMIKLET